MESSLRGLRLLALAAAAWLIAAAAALATQNQINKITTTPKYRLTHELALPGDEGWDYLTFDAGSHRLFIAHGTRVLVLDADRLAVAGEIADTPGVHGIALAPELGRGYVSAGRAGMIVVFDLKTLARLKEIKTTGENPDAILYEPLSQRVFSFNGRGHNVTAVDAKTDTVVGTIELDARPEFAVTDGKGRVYVNLEDKDSLAQLDPVKLSVSVVWPISGCKGPSGLAIDAAVDHLYSVCENHVMAMIDGSSGSPLGAAVIGGGVDAAAYDPQLRLAFASCGEGVLTVVRRGVNGVPEVAQEVLTRRGARTMALDPVSHRIFMVTANFGTAPAASAEQPRPRPPQLPGTFRLLVLEVEPAAESGAARP